MYDAHVWRHSTNFFVLGITVTLEIRTMFSILFALRKTNSFFLEEKSHNLNKSIFEMDLKK